MRAVAVGEGREGSRGNRDAGIVNVIRVFAGRAPCDSEQQLVLVFIEALHAAHGPLAFGELPLQLAICGIVYKDMIPAIALAHPENLVGFCQIACPKLAGVVDESLGRVLKECLGGTAGRIDTDHPHELVAALVIRKEEPR